MSESGLKTYTYGPRAGQKPQQLVVLLHGLGADGRDLIDLAPYFAEVLPDAVFVSPNAPFPCDMAPMGYQWFSLQEWTPESILRGVQRAAPIVQDYITAQLKKYELPASKLALIGFSQGTMMALYTGPRYPDKIAGILGYSGALVWEDDVDPEALHKVPVHLVHGTADSVVPFSAYEHALHTLEKEAFPVSGEVREGLGHGIDPAGIETGQSFLRQVLR